MSDTWTIGSALAWTQGYLERKGDENPRLSAQWLLSEATGLSRIELYAYFDKPLSASEREVLRDVVARRGRGEPLQYITGEVGFRHITLSVRPGVLIPRPETEVLVSEALALLGEGKAARVVDLCTGSGCIACSIASEHPCAEVLATDLAPEAVRLAQANAEKLNLADRVTVLEGDLGSPIPEEYRGRIDLVVSNPPYVPTGMLDGLPQEVAGFEPRLALDGGPDGLEVFRRIVPWAAGALSAAGAALFELHETTLARAAALAEGAGFASTRVVSDLAGRDRVLIAFMPDTPFAG
ncbi:MAG: peptide chain release factor N(5)-glutamine methyltransferase [Eggerthellaceae bacterium]|nr:peptide chain release factor N(5)-glutamine methyltransferase [Eggerthellaceae bacterium]MDR2715943.1 peptide chain release factor N(5)-glutamine methyltransferase [Coriobacteriaceae bacterium]